MALEWEPADPAEHAALPRGTVRAAGDPGWDAVVAELAAGNAVRIRYADDEEREALAQEVARRAALRGFAADVRTGDGFLSVGRQAEEDRPARRRNYQSRESTEEGR